MKKLIVVLVLILLLPGCTTVEVLYREEEVIPAGTAVARTQQAAWWTIFAEVFALFDTVPKTAIENQTGYKRSMGIVRVRTEESCEN